MDKLLKFFVETGKLKDMPRRGWVLRNIKNPESIAAHTFRVALFAWVLGKKKNHLKVDKLIKMALIHDLCETYSGDITPYDSLLKGKSKKQIDQLLKTWPRFSDKERKRLAEKKFKKEKAGLEKLIKNLPNDLASEMKHLWLDYENGTTAEGRFFKQADRLENFLQSLEYWKKFGKPPQKPWWDQARELFDDPTLLELVAMMEKTFHRTKKPMF
jgi:putative hydrolase of HD superfamily